MYLIWFNPDVREYQHGEIAKFKKLKSESNNPEGFTLLYKFASGSSALAEKIIRSLNQARDEKLDKVG
ncbi:MAG TPA: hypothetical protein ACFCUD_15290 [Cyclobacteriaceae bacterium]